MPTMARSPRRGLEKRSPRSSRRCPVRLLVELRDPFDGRKYVYRLDVKDPLSALLVAALRAWKLECAPLDGMPPVVSIRVDAPSRKSLTQSGGSDENRGSL